MNDAHPKLELRAAAAPQPPLPSDSALDAGLAIAFARPVTLIARSPFVATSTHPTELLTLEWGGVVRRFLCKYSAGRHRVSWGHRGGVEHEGRVYQHVLRPLGITDPVFYGAYEDPITGWTWLLLEYLHDAVQIHETADCKAALLQAAQWLGAFHAAGQDRLPAPAHDLLIQHDAPYYEGWIRRTLEYSAPLHSQYPWFAAFCGRAMELLAILLDPPHTAIHGEFYAQNVLYARNRICPIDWESAALGAGEIDLASLLEGWSPQTATICVDEYCRARWPAGAPADFDRRMDAAEAYLTFRWSDEWAVCQKHFRGTAWRYARLFEIGQRWGLISEGERALAD